MCGIAGIISTTTTDLRAIQLMTERLAHRGPDSGALLFAEPGKPSQLIASDTVLGDPIVSTAALGHRRLSIIDPGPQGLQPMRVPGTDTWITYNGEIYNYRELRAELEAAGHRFATATDTEVILRAYLAWGPACFARFNGMWALAILDLKKRELILSRDRFGIKPLYLDRRGPNLAFASEIKSLLHARKPRLNPSAAKSFLTSYLVSHTADTFFEGIEAFPPAHYAVISLTTPTSITPIRYWDYPTGRLDPSDAEATNAFKELFASSIDLHMRSDVPVGSCLSGGLDSSSIVCMARRILGNASPFHTFTALFADKSIDESPWVKAVNDATHATPHHVTPTATDLLRDIDTLIWHQDEPFISTSIYAQWCVMQTAREAGIPVLLDGQGADEILCGYKKFYIHYLKLLYAGRQFGAALRETSGYLLHGDRTLFRLGDAQRYLPKALRADLSALASIAKPVFAEAATLASPGLAAGGSVGERQKNDLTFFSLPALLRFEDRNSMAFSIESRVPFLDHRLVEFALQLSPSHKMRNGQGKYVMRNAIADLVPPSITARRDKMGFGAPQQRWLGEGIISAFQSDIRRGEYALGPLFAADKLQLLLQTYRHEVPPTLSRLLFQLFVLNRWGLRFQVDFSA